MDRGHNRELLPLALGHEQPIKGIAMEGRQSIHLKRMAEMDREGHDVVAHQVIGHKRGEIAWDAEFAQAGFHRHLPATGGAEKQCRAAIADEAPGLRGQALIVLNPPQERVGIQ